MADTAFSAWVRTLTSAGLTQDGDEFPVVRNISGTETALRQGPARRGYVPAKDLVTVLTGGQNIHAYDPTNDRGYLLRSKGSDVNIIQVPNYAFTAIDVDATYGEPYFLVARRSVALVYVNGQTGTNLRPGPENDTPNPLSSTAGLTTLSTAIVGDCAYVAGSTNLYYVLFTGTYATLGNWHAMPSGAPGLMTVYNDDNVQLIQNGAERRYTFIGPNQLVSS